MKLYEGGPIDPMKTYFPMTYIDKITRTAIFDMTPEEFGHRFREWQSGLMIQEAFDNLSDEEREFLLTGITPAIWNDIFGKER